MFVVLLFINNKKKRVFTLYRSYTDTTTLVYSSRLLSGRTESNNTSRLFLSLLCRPTCSFRKNTSSSCWWGVRRGRNPSLCCVGRDCSRLVTSVESSLLALDTSKHRQLPPTWDSASLLTYFCFCTGARTTRMEQRARCRHLWASRSSIGRHQRLYSRRVER